MKLVMTLLVRDEADIVESTIRYHLDRGVDFIIVTDNRSTDATPDILREFERSGVVRVIDEPRDDYSQGKWVTRMARMAAKVDGANWVINGDADEFWWPDEGDLKSVLGGVPADVGVIEVQRHDFVPVPDGGEPFHQRMTVRKTASLDVTGQPLAPKVVHRAHPRVTVAQGNHRVVRPRLAPLGAAAPIEILHFPLRGSEQFRNKIVKGGAAYARNRRLTKRVGHGWRHLYELDQQGRLDDYFRDQVQTPDAIEAGLADGRFVRDERLRDFIDRRAVRWSPP